MRILELELQHFRNYSGQRVSFDPDCNVIFGENAQGKTNLLEAIVYLSCGKSPRARTDREMIAFDAPAAVLEAGSPPETGSSAPGWSCTGTGGGRCG